MTLAGRRVLVTGADGFIGSHLVERLVEEGADVTAFCIYNSQSSRGWLDEIGRSSQSPANLKFVLGDVRDEGFVRSVCDGMDTIFHLAALIAIPYSYLAPSSFYETNVRGTLNILEAARMSKVRRVISTSTSEVYGTPDVVPIRETHPLKGQSPYSASKIAADKLCEAWASSFDVPVVTLRPFNTYGPRQSARAVIPTILSQLLSGRREVKLGSLDTRRDLTFVHDTVDGFVRAALAPDIEGRVIQLGTGEAFSVAEMFQAACRACEVEAEIVPDGDRLRPGKSEVQVLLSDPSLASALLGWRSTISLEDGLRRTAIWMRGAIAHYRPDEYTI